MSLLYAETRDERLLNAFRDAVDSTMQTIETEAATRVRKRGENENRTTGNLAWGEFIHTTARPVDGEPDPHLHAHCFVFNVTFDKTENAWKAGQFRGLKADAPYFEALYHARLSHKLADLGLPIERTAKGWELGILTPELLKKFSRRTSEIEEKAKELGIDDPDAKAELGAKTRNRKAKEMSFAELQTRWRERMTTPEQSALDRLAKRIGGNPAPRDGTAADRAVQYAVDHEFERSSVVPERRLLATALKRAVGAARPEDVIDRYRAADLIRAVRDGRALVTSAGVLAEERAMVAFAKHGRASCPPLVGGDYKIKRDWLNASQQAAVRHILGSRDRVLVVRGAAGVGKTSLMQEAVEAIQRAGTKVFAFAPSAAASRGVQRAEGFNDADTVARLLVDDKLQRKARGQVLWIDEAGLLGTRTLRDLFRLADSIDARVLLSGDRKQHGSIERGAALRLLEEEGGVKPCEVTEIQRQRGEYKKAVKHLSEGRVGEGFAALDELGWIRAIPDDQRYQALAADYAQAVAEKQTALVVSPTHHEGRRITGEIRRLLKEQGSLGREEREFVTLESTQLTEAEKTDPANYHAGDVVQFFQNAPGFRKGQRLTIGDGTPPLAQSHRYSVFHPLCLRLAQGDVIRITQNGFTADVAHRLDNGDVFTVKAFDKRGNIVLANGWTIGREFGHLSYGYVATSHASQGQTVDRVFIGQSSDSAAAASREQFYVSCSRAKRQATIYTDDKAALLEAVSHGDDRVTATELALDAKRRETMTRFQRLNSDFDRSVKQPAKELVHER